MRLKLSLREKGKHRRAACISASVGSDECMFNTGASILKQERHAALTEACHVNLYPTCPPIFFIWEGTEKSLKSV